jgi:hypothetical protein
MTSNEWDYIVITLLGFTTQSHEYKVLIQNKICDIVDIITMDKEILLKLTADDEDDKGKIILRNAPMKAWQVNKFMIMKDMLMELAENAGGISNLTEDDYTGITTDFFNEYRLHWSGNSKTTQPTINTSGVSSTNNNTNTGHSGSSNHSELQNFIRSIKKDRSQYEVIKDDRQFDNWQRSFLAVARTHKLEEIFDENYTPDGNKPEEFQLWQEKQRFVYSVFDLTLKTDYGKTLVRKYQHTFDAQKIWVDFVKYMRSSTKAQMAASELLSWLTSSRFDRNWRGTSRSYILYWQNRVQEYESYMDDPQDHFTDLQKTRMLQNTVQEYPELRQVRINMDHARVQNRKELKYCEYTDLLLSAADAYDNMARNSKVMYAINKFIN